MKVNTIETSSVLLELMDKVDGMSDMLDDIISYYKDYHVAAFPYLLYKGQLDILSDVIIQMGIDTPKFIADKITYLYDTTLNIWNKIQVE